MELSGKVALITGASRGIGSAIAEELAKQGASVAINFSRDIEGAEATLQKVNNLGGYGKLFKKDISNFTNCKELIEEVIKTFGKIDILVNNAGKANIGLFMDQKEDEILELINTNLMSSIYLSKFAVNEMVKQGKGNIINISSIWGQVGASCEVVYSATKGGIDSFTKALAKEVAPFGIRVNAVSPGVIDTKMNNSLSIDEKDELIETIPYGRFGHCGEVAKAVVFLCSDNSSYLTAQIIRVDGGLI